VLIENNKFNSTLIKEIIRSLLLCGQVKSTCEILERIPLDFTGISSVWENFVEFCCSQDHIKILRELIDKLSMRVLPKNNGEITFIYNAFLATMLNSKFTLPCIKLTLEDVARYKIKIKGSVVKELLIKVIEDNPDPRSFIHKILILRYTIDVYTYSAMISRLVQLKKTCEVMTLVDLILNDNGFGFTWSDLNLNTNDLKYIVQYQNLAIKVLKEGWKKNLDSTDKMHIQSETMSIIDQLSLEDFEPLQNEDFEFLNSISSSDNL